MAFRTENFFLPVHEVSFFLELKLHCHWFDFFLPRKTWFKWVLHGNKVFWIILKCYNVLWHVPSTKTEHMNLLIAIAMLQMTPKLNSIIHHMFFYHIRFSMGQESRSGLVGASASDPEGVRFTEKWSFSELWCWQCSVVHRLLQEELKFFSGCWPMMILSSLMWDLYNMVAYSNKGICGKVFC